MAARRPVIAGLAFSAVAVGLLVPAPSVAGPPVGAGSALWPAAAQEDRRLDLGSDAVPVRRPRDRMRLPGVDRLAPTWRAQAGPERLAQSRRRTARYPIALSFVVIPVRGQRLGFSRGQVAAMATRVGQRMLQQTDGRFTFGVGSWTMAPKVRASRLSCDIYRLHREYSDYAAHLRRPPAGFRRTIAVYLTPPRAACGYAGIAMLGGRATYLNGLFLRDPQRLQDWITAHELGHNLGLDHSASFWPSAGAWSPSDRIPVNDRAQGVSTYGDYLDLMGQPPRGGASLRGADFSRWMLSSLNLHSLGVLRDRNVVYVRRSGSYQLSRLWPDPDAGVMTLAIPVIADGLPTYWVIEFRPPAENAQGPNYPEPYVSRGYGARLLLVGHGAGAFPNKVFHSTRHAAAAAALPFAVPVKLGGGATVTVTPTADPSILSVTVAVAG